MTPCAELEQDKLAQIAQASTAAVIEEAAEDAKKRSRNFLVTWYNYTDDWAQVLRKIDAVKEFHGQVEKGKKSGRLHVQLALAFKDAKTLTAARKQMGEFEGWFLIAKNWAKVKNYCTKKDTRVSKPVHSDEQKWEFEDPMEGCCYRKWQKELLDIIDSKPDRRKLRWYVDRKGNAGKSTFALHMIGTRPDEVLAVDEANCRDIKFAISKVVRHQKEVLKKSLLRCIIFDIARDDDQIEYKMLEKIKSCWFFNGKYESGTDYWNPVHVVVFANREPDFERASEDRWIVHEITEEDLYVTEESPPNPGEPGGRPPSLEGACDPPEPPGVSEEYSSSTEHTYGGGDIEGSVMSDWSGWSSD